MVKLDGKETHLKNLRFLAQGLGHGQGSNVSLRSLCGHLLHSVTVLVFVVVAVILSLLLDCFNG